MGFYKAKFKGTCEWEKCPKPNREILPGDSITWNPNVKPTKYFHETCMVAVKAERKGLPAPAEIKDRELKVEAEVWVKAGLVRPVEVGDVVRGVGEGENEVYTGVVKFVRAPDEHDRAEVREEGALVAVVLRDDRMNGNATEVDENGVRMWRCYKTKGMEHFGSNCTAGTLEVQFKKTEVKDMKKASAGQDSEKDGAAAGLEKMALLLAPYIKAGVNEAEVAKLVEAAMAPVREEVKKIVEYRPTKIEVVMGDKKPKKMDRVHEKFETLLRLINLREHVYMWGPPGSGKSTAAKQVSESLELDYGYISLNPQTPDSRILGFMDAHGTYRPTVFRSIYEKGGVMCIDELDNASPSLCVTINTGLENGHMAFPDKMVERHKNFVLVATGNTAGRGANPAFPERRPFDSAFAERFTYVEWDYDRSLEMDIAKSINEKAVPWVEWVWKLRAFCKKNHPRVIVSPRASIKGAKLLTDKKFKAKEIAEMVVWKGLDESTVKSILNSVPMVEA